jgi:hypothetical protein
MKTHHRVDARHKAGHDGRVTARRRSVIARSAATKQSRNHQRFLDCFVAALLATTATDASYLQRSSPLNWNTWIRQIHRWLSIIFTATVVANFVTMGLGAPPSWIVYSPLPPLFLLLFTGLYMFVLPYAAKWRGERRVAR